MFSVPSTFFQLVLDNLYSLIFGIFIFFTEWGIAPLSKPVLHNKYCGMFPPLRSTNTVTQHKWPYKGPGTLWCWGVKDLGYNGFSVVTGS
jgi:hypothetical protein